MPSYARSRLVLRSASAAAATNLERGTAQKMNERIEV